MLHFVYLTGVDTSEEGYFNSAVRGVRQARTLCGEDDGFREARKTVSFFLDNSHTAALVASHSDEKIAKAAAEALSEYSQNIAVGQIDLKDLALSVPEIDDGVDPEDEELLDQFSSDAYRTAIVLLSMSEGVPASAMLRATFMERATGDIELYAEVRRVLLDIFTIDMS